MKNLSLVVTLIIASFLGQKASAKTDSFLIFSPVAQVKLDSQHKVKKIKQFLDRLFAVSSPVHGREKIGKIVIPFTPGALAKLEVRVVNKKTVYYRVPMFKSHIRDMDLEDIDLQNYEKFLVTYRPL